MKRVVVVPIGDIAGVGPEIVVKALEHPEVYDWCRPVVVGEKAAVKRAAAVTGSKLEIHCVDKPEDGIYRHGVINLIDMKNVDSESI